MAALHDTWIEPRPFRGVGQRDDQGEYVHGEKGAGKTTETTRFLLVDDHVHARAVLHRWISLLPSGEVVAEAGNGEEALRLIPVHKPHVVLMDIVMPGMDGLQAAEYIKNNYPDIRIILYTGHDTHRFQQRAQAVHVDALYTKEELTFLELQALVARWFPPSSH
ncbi:MAG: response regulator [Chloroflexi bacterium]|nr:response regulator [Chloroflexota bacterium]